MLAPQDNLEDQEMMPLPESPDQKDRLDHQENQEVQDQVANRELQLSAKHSFRANQAQPETKARQDHQDHQEHPEPMDCQEHQDPKDQTDQKDQLEMMDNPEHKDHLDLPELPVRRVFARNTVPSTAECSSRTELVAKPLQHHLPNSPIVCICVVIFLIGSERRRKETNGVM